VTGPTHKYWIVVRLLRLLGMLPSSALLSAYLTHDHATLSHGAW